MKVSELKKNLELVKPGIGTNTSIDQATSIVFRDNCAYSFNDEIAVIAPLHSRSDITKDNTCGAVPAQKLYEFISKLPQDQEIEAFINSEKSEFFIKSGKSKAGIKMDCEIRLPLTEELAEPAEWVTLPDNFISALQRSLGSAIRAGKEKPMLHCVHFTDNFVEACDTYRLTRSSLKLQINQDINIIACNLDRLKDYSPIELGIGKDWVHFRNADNVRYCCRLIKEKYPELGHFLSVDGALLELPDDLQNALSRAEVFTDDKSKLSQVVYLSISRMGLEIDARDSYGWEREEPMRIRYSGPTIKFSTNPNHLREMLAISNKVVLGPKSILIEGVEFVHVVAFKITKE
jgi:DNA polymerase III sliding clamp (beta) subunit (PCNA family)